MIDTKNFYINGAWVTPLSGSEIDVINPSTEQVCAVVSIGGQADTNAAVAAAKAAFNSWRQTSKSHRLTLLKRFL